MYIQYKAQILKKCSPSLLRIWSVSPRIHRLEGIPGPYNYAGQNSGWFFKLTEGKYHGKKAKNILSSE